MLFGLSLEDFWIFSCLACRLSSQDIMIASQPDSQNSQDSTWERQFSGHLATRSGCDPGCTCLPPQPSFDPAKINSFTYPRHAYQPIAKLPHPFISACLTCKAWRCNTQMRLAQGTGSRPPGVTNRCNRHVSS